MITLILLALAANFVNSANILGMFTLLGYSHFTVYKPLLEELSKRGHNVDVVSHFPRESPIPRYTDLSIKGLFPGVEGTLDMNDLRIGSVFDQLTTIYQKYGAYECEASLNTSVLQNLKTTQKKYDIMITDIFFSDCMLGFTYLFDIPSIAFICSANLPWLADRIGLPDNPSYISNYFLGYTTKMTVLERMHNTAIYYMTKLWFDWYAIERLNVIAKQFFGPKMPHLRNLANNVSLILSNTHFTMQQSTPITPNFIQVGGIHIVENTTLSKEFQQSLNTDLDGVVYVSFGSIFMADTFPKEKLQALFDAFDKLPYKILWKGDRSKFSKDFIIPKNIQFEPWMPQLAILCDPNVKLFISHGGLLGLQEAIYCGVPVLGVPVWVDQFLNTKAVIDLGLCREVPFSKLSKDAVLEAAQELLKNPKYKANAMAASKLYRDRPMSPLETAVYWTEYVINHRAAPHLRSISADLSWYIYLCLDLLLILTIPIFFILCYLYYKYVTKSTLKKSVITKNKNN